MKLCGDWISGFVDGDGGFHIQKIGETDLLRHRFICSQDKRSVDVLYAMKTFFGCGTVHRAGGNMMNFEITSRAHLRDKVIPFFSGKPLQTIKREKYVKFVESLRNHMISKGERPPPAHFIPPSGGLSAGWFRGFVDAEGCFVVSLVGGRVLPQFIIGLGQRDAEILEECRRFLKCGTCYTRKNGVNVFQVSAIADLESVLIPLFCTRGSAVLLRTTKRLSFQKFRKIVRLIVEKKHLSPEGMEKIQKLQAGLNKHPET